MGGVRELTKQLAGIEDLTLGNDTETQTRNGTEYVITKISGASLPNDTAGGSSIKEVTAVAQAAANVMESVPAAKYDLPVTMNKPYHQPHLENFFAAVRGKAKLNCPGEIGYETAVTVLKVNEAIAAGKKLEFKPEDFEV